MSTSEAASAEGAAEHGIGQSVPRREDLRLLTGKGRYNADIDLPGQTYAVMLRSPHAHARIGAIDAREALALPGVLAVLTGHDWLADGLKDVRHNYASRENPEFRLIAPDGSPSFIAPSYPLSADKARYVGEVVALVVAETPDLAEDAAERVRINYQPLPSVTHTQAAREPTSPRVWDEAHANLCLATALGDDAATTAAFESAAHIVRLDTTIGRVTGVPMEPRAALGIYHRDSGRFTLYGGAGGVVIHQREIAGALNVPIEAIRVVTNDVGGNFGTRNWTYPELPLVLWASRRVGRPVKWVGKRQESFLSDFQGRDLVVEAELALDRDGNFLALRALNTGNLGAHTVSFVPLIKGVVLMSSVYRIPVAHIRAGTVLSNTPSTAPYRSAGRPEVMYVIERLIDLAARRHGFDRIALRRQNLVSEPPGYVNPLGVTYDGGAYTEALDAALSLGDWQGFPARRDAALRRGRLRGIGIANYIEAATGAPRERTEIVLRPEGRADITIGTQSSGQGHETSFAQLIAEWLGVPIDRIGLASGDTDRVSVGGGSHAGRSMRIAGLVIRQAVDEIIAKGRHIAGHLLEAAPADIEFARGRFAVSGTDRSVPLFAVVAAALERNDLPDNLRGPLSGVGDVTFRGPASPYGCHICEVEIDPETGAIEIARYGAVDDVGRAINPLIVDGRTHGGIVQGLGQALMENCHYDPVTGQLLTASFMDYAMPRADSMPPFDTMISEIPSPTNPLGIRAGGEGGTTPALAVVMNAIVDALDGLGVTHVEMPATPERIWRAILSAQEANQANNGASG